MLYYTYVKYTTQIPTSLLLSNLYDDNNNKNLHTRYNTLAHAAVVKIRRDGGGQIKQSAPKSQSRGA